MQNISSLGLTDKTLAYLNGAGIETVEQLRKLSYLKLLYIPKMNKARAKEVIACLASLEKKGNTTL